MLVVLDGSKALRTAVNEVFTPVPVQRCVRHKERNVLDHLPERDRPAVKMRLRRAWATDDHALALDGLRVLASELERSHPGAAASLREGLEETLTLTRLGIFGVVCVTRENQSAPWLNFEAGALAKAVDSSRVVPLAIDLKPSDIEIPLGQFQSQPASEAGIGEVLASLNAASPTPLSDELLKKASKMWWPELESELQRIEHRSAPASRGAPARSDRELLEEMLDTVRSLARGRQSARPRGPAERSLPKDHPFLAELNELLEGYDAVIMHASTARRIGLRTRRLSSDLREVIRERAELYGVTVDFMDGPRGASSKGLSGPGTDRSGEPEPVGDADAPPL